MAGVRLFLMNSVVNHASRCSDDITTNPQFRVQHFQSLVHSRCYMIKPRSALSQNCLKNNRSMSLHSSNPTYPVSASRVSRTYTSFFGSKEEHDPRVSISLVANQSNVHSTDAGGSDWSASSKKAPQSNEDATVYTRQKTEAASNELTPHVQQSLETYPYLITATTRDPYLINAIIPVTGTLLAWLVVLKVFTKLYKHWYPSKWKYFWGSLEEPLLYLATFMAFSYIGSIIAPTLITFQNIKETWKVAAALSSAWFLSRYTDVLFTALMDLCNIKGFHREILLARNKLLSVCLFIVCFWILEDLSNLSSVGSCILGLIAFAKKCGVGVLLTVAGIGGFIILNEERRRKSKVEMAHVATPRNTRDI